MNYTKCTYISWSKYEESPEIKVTNGDILLVKTGSSYGKCALVTELPQKATINPQFVVLKYIAINKRYLTIILQSDYARRNYNNFVLGTAIPTFTQAILGNMLVPLPPIMEQQRIVADVERWFALIDQVEQGKADLQTIIKQTKSKILDLAIHGKLVPQDPNDEPAIELLKRIHPDFTPCDNAHYGKLPEGWCFSKLGSVGVWQSGGTPSRSSPAYYNGVIPWLKIADLPDGYVTNCSEKISHDAINNSSAKVNPEGSVALAMYGSIGKLGILTFQAATNQAICVCSLFKGVDSKYLFYFLMSQREEFIRKAGGGVQSNISKDIIVNHPITLPPLAEQLKIV